MNFLKIGLQFWITSGVSVLSMRFFKAVDCMKEWEMVIHLKIYGSIKMEEENRLKNLPIL